MLESLATCALLQAVSIHTSRATYYICRQIHVDLGTYVPAKEQIIDLGLSHGTTKASPIE